MSCKAYNLRCIVEWLSYELAAATREARDERIPAMSTCVTLECTLKHPETQP